MKIRLGFVSNSSSSSYTVLLPDDFTVDKIDWERKWVKDSLEEYEDGPEELRKMVGKALDELKKGEVVYSSEYDDQYPYQVYSIRREGLSEYVIASAEGGASGCDSIAGARTDKVREILGESHAESRGK